MIGTPTAIQILPHGARGTLSVPSSKSHTNRALLLAALANGDSIIRNPLRSDDAEAMTQALRALGVSIDDAGDRLVVHGTGGFRPPDGAIDCRDSGTTIRFLTAAASLAGFPVTLTGSAQLCARPLGPMLDALVGLGVAVDSAAEGRPPVTVRGHLRSFSATVDASQSSQYASAMLMVLGASGRADASLTVRSLVSRPYVSMTLDSMRAFGVEWAESPTEPDVYRPARPGGFAPADYAVEFDASAAAHIWAVAAASGGSVTVAQAHRHTGQPDIRILDVLQRMGCRVSETRDGIAVYRSGPLKSPGAVDMADWPDQVTTVAVLAALAEGETTITGVEHARGHETDRLAATAVELRKLGAAVEERRDGLVIRGGAASGARIDTYGDHRMAMAFAAAGAALGGVVIENPACVRKTYPGFWDDLSALGVSWTEAAP